MHYTFTLIHSLDVDFGTSISSGDGFVSCDPILFREVDMVGEHGTVLLPKSGQLYTIIFIR